MNVLGFAIVCVIIIVHTFIAKERILFRLPIYFVVFDAFYALGKFDFFGTIRNIILLLIVSYLFLRTYKFVLRNYLFVIILLAYFLFRVIYTSSSVLASINAYINFFIPILLYPVSIKICKSDKEFFILLKNTFYAIVFFTFFMIISNTFNIGYDQYKGGFESGFTFEKIFFLSFGLLIMPMYLTYIQPHKRFFSIMIIVFSFVLIVINMNRSSLIIVLIGVLVYLIFKRNKPKQIFYILTLSLLFLFGLYLFRDTLTRQYKARIEIIEKRKGIENEGRFMEFQIIIPESIEGKTVFFGKEAFNSTGHYGNGVFLDRPLHVDLMIIYFGFGLLGIVLYLFIFYKLFQNIFKYKMYKEKLFFYNLLFILFLSFLLGRFAVLFSGGLLVSSYNSLVFIYLGTIVSIFKRKSYQLQVKRRFLIN
jgi:hypothetical protein